MVGRFFCCDKRNLTTRSGNNTFGVSDSVETPQEEDAKRSYFQSN